ncbi:MAG: type II secretion system F family protein, partial [candidate division Zixibacteria bacterium]|nr:type II secretion system F family protein [candidate division Zixibacteria bacterium]
MPLYTYQAVDNKNKQVKGTLPAHTLEDVEGQIREMGLYPISVQAKAKRKSSGFGSGKVTSKDVLSFTIQLHLMFTAGLPLLQSLQNIAEQEKNPKFQEVIGEICKKIETTGSFSEALAAFPKIFPPFYLGAVRAGEGGGTLAEILDELADSLEKQDALQAELKQAMMYPCMIMVVMSAVTGFYAFYLMPKMMKLVLELGVPIPWYTRGIQFIIGSIMGLWIPIVVFAVIGFVALIFYRKTESGAYTLAYMRMKIPLFGQVIQKSILCTFSHYLSLLLRSGFGLLPSLDLVKGTIGNKTIVRSIETIEERIKRGESFADSMKGLPFPGFMITMIGLGEKTGRVAEQLALINAYFEKDVQRTTKKVLTIMEPLILVVFGGISAIILLSTFFPLYNS